MKLIGKQYDFQAHYQNVLYKICCIINNAGNERKEYQSHMVFRGLGREYNNMFRSEVQ